MRTPIIFLATIQQKSPNIFPSLFYSNQKILSKAELQWTKVLLDVLLSEMLILHKSKTMLGIPIKLAQTWKKFYSERKAFSDNLVRLFFCKLIAFNYMFWWALMMSWLLMPKDAKKVISLLHITTLWIYQYWIFHHTVIETCFEMLNPQNTRNYDTIQVINPPIF